MAGGAERHRRRQCNDCAERFTTYEKTTDAFPQVVKRSGDRAAFDFGRIRGSILRATEKRPVAAAEVETAVGRIRRRLPLEEGGEIPSARIGEWVMEELRALDRVAYVRFAAGRRRFVDLAELPAASERPEAGPESRDEPGRRARARPDPEPRDPQLPLVPRDPT